MPVVLCQLLAIRHTQLSASNSSSGDSILELIDAVHPLGLLIRVDEAAERGLELLAAGAVRHSTQARAIPVDLARLRVKCALLACLLLELLGRLLRVSRCRDRCCGVILALGRGGLLGLRGRRFLLLLRLEPRVELLALPLDDGVDGRQVVLGELWWLGGVARCDTESVG